MVVEVCLGVIIVQYNTVHHCCHQLDPHRDINQFSWAESIEAVHAVAAIQTQKPLIRGNWCMNTATANWTIGPLQPTCACRDGDLKPQQIRTQPL